MDIIQGGWSPLARVGVNGLHRTHPPPHHLLHWCPHTQMTMTIFMMVMMANCITVMMNTHLMMVMMNKHLKMQFLFLNAGTTYNSPAGQTVSGDPQHNYQHHKVLLLAPQAALISTTKCSY